MKPRSRLNQILLLVLCIACLPASFAASRYVHAWTVIAHEDIDKRLYTEDPGYVPSASARLTTYARALPGYPLFTAPVFVAALAPLIVAALLFMRLVQPSRSFRSAGWVLFAASVLSSGVLAYLGIISGARGWPFLVLAALLVFTAFYPIVPDRSNATNVA